MRPRHPRPGAEGAPFLSFDADPYPVVVDGRTLWVLDGYTTTDRYPYSQTRVAVDGGLNSDFNYVRNSVKATVDAYDGTSSSTSSTPKDPIIHSYREAFPDLFTDFSKMPPALKAHLPVPGGPVQAPDRASTRTTT